MVILKPFLLIGGIGLRLLVKMAVHCILISLEICSIILKRLKVGIAECA